MDSNKVAALMSKSFLLFGQNILYIFIQPSVKDTNNSYKNLFLDFGVQNSWQPRIFKNICIPSLRWNESIVVQLVMT